MLYNYLEIKINVFEIVQTLFLWIYLKFEIVNLRIIEFERFEDEFRGESTKEDEDASIRETQHL